MKSDINTITLSGRLTDATEIRHLDNGMAVASFDVANNQFFYDKKNSTPEKPEFKKKVFFLRCNLWGANAERLQPHLNKGAFVIITGNLVQDNWETDGKKRTAYKLNVNSIQIPNTNTSRESEAEGPDAGDDPST